MLSNNEAGLEQKTIQLIKKRALPALLLVFVLAASQLISGTICVLEATIGMPCPSCGMTRAYLSLIHGDIGQAFNYHPLFWTVPAVGGVILIKHFKYRNTTPKWYTVFFTVLISAFILLYIVRMILYFPHTAPMQTNPDAILRRIFRLITPV